MKPYTVTVEAHDGSEKSVYHTALDLVMEHKGDRLAVEFRPEPDAEGITGMIYLKESTP